MRVSSACVAVLLSLLASPASAQEDTNACPWESASTESVQRDSASFAGAVLHLQSRFYPARGRYTYCVYNTHPSALAYAEWGDDKGDLLFDLPVPAQKRVPAGIDSVVAMQSARQQFDFGVSKRRLTDTKNARTIYEARALQSPSIIKVAAPAGEFRSFAQTVPDPTQLFREVLSDPGLTRDVFLDRLPADGVVGVSSSALVYFPRDREIFGALLDQGFEGPDDSFVGVWIDVVSGLTRRDGVPFITTFAAIFPGPENAGTEIPRFDFANEVRLSANGPTLTDAPTIFLGELIATDGPPNEKRAALAEAPLRDAPITLASGRLRITDADGRPIGSMRIPLLTQE